MRASNLLALWIVAMAATTAAVEAKGRCEPKIGPGTGYTLTIAKLKSFQGILKATGNWPEQKGYVSKPIYKCVAFGGLWQCAVRATICKI